MKKVSVGIIGATGYAGAELLRILLGHPQADVVAISSVSFEGKPIDEVYPNFYRICGDVLTDENGVIEKSDIVFASLPHGLCEALAEKALAKGKRFIDLGADFRLADEADYNEWYGLSYEKKELHQKSCYCIPELHADRLNEAVSIIGNPGCYPTSIGLGLAPIVAAGMAKLDSIVIDSKSGTTGAGRGLTQLTHHPDCNEAFQPYKVACHRHTPEIEQTVSELAGEAVRVTFVPHLLPVNRGIVSTIYLTLNEAMSEDELQAIYQSFYEGKPFVRVMKKGGIANLRNVKYSNYCDISLHLDNRTNRLVIISTIDNMVKGAAGQAIQNMNLLCGLPEDCGLQLIPPAF